MKLWKLLGVAGLAGVAATGVAVARAERRRRAFEPEEVRARLHDRHQQALQPDPPLPSAAGVDRGVPPGAGRRGTDGAAGQEITLDEAVELTRTGDLWLFRGRSVPDRAIRAFTNSPVNHVGMAVVLDEMPPLMWHAELGQSLPDLWAGAHHRGVQLHDLRAAVTTWTTKYDQQGWLRQLNGEVSREMEDAMLREIARMDGTPFPASMALAGRWLRGRIRRPARLEVTYCAEVVAGTYQAMGLLGGDRPRNWYDPGRFWSGDRLRLEQGASLGAEIAVTLGTVEPDAAVVAPLDAVSGTWLGRRSARRRQRKGLKQSEGSCPPRC